MKKVRLAFILICLVLVVTCCSKEISKNNNENIMNNSQSVDDVLNNNTSDNKDDYDDKENDINDENIDNSDIDDADTQGSNISQGIDYDLTTMGKDMVYATVFQLMRSPSDYSNKVIKMKGIYYSETSPYTNITYRFCIIKDALGCCEQGLEFELKDESKGYPKQDSEITVQGIFETYTEDDDPTVYCRLKDCVILKE